MKGMLTPSQQVMEFFMAHNIEFIDGKAAMAYAGKVPWHGLGVSVPADLTPEQMLDAANLNWTVEKKTCFIYNSDTEQFESSDITALVRSSDNKVLTHVGTDWNPMNNIDAFRFFNEYVMAGDMEMNTAGSLQNGKIVWALAKVKDSFVVKTPQGDDIIDSYLLFTNPHKYGQSIDVRFTPIRVECNNMLTMALGQKTSSMVKVNHKNKFDEEKVKETLGIAHHYMQDYGNLASFLASRNYTKDSLKEYFKSVFPKTTKNAMEHESSRNAELASNLVETQPGAEFAKGTWWQAYNAVTFMTDHIVGRNADTRLSSAWYGENQRRKLDALNMAKQFATAA